MWTVNGLILLALFALINAMLVWFLGSYLKKKGENLATHEDLNKVVEQMSAVTAATKKIEADISSGVWDKQKRWEMRRDILFEVTKRVAALYDAIGQLQVVLRTQNANVTLKASQVGQQMKVDANMKYFARMAELKESQFFVEVTCGNEVADAIDTFNSLVTRVAAGINDENAQIFNDSLPEIIKFRNGIRDAIRKELAIDTTMPQSNESLAAPIPAPQAR